MAAKNITIKIDDKDTPAIMRRVKKREFKSLIMSLSGKGDEFAKLIAEPNFLHRIPGLVEENIDYVCETLIMPFVNVSADQLDEMDMVDIINLFKELMTYNNLDIEKIKNFLRPDPVTRRAFRQMLNFDGEPAALPK